MRLLFLSFLMTSLLFISCGGDDADNTTEEETSSTTQETDMAKGYSLYAFEESTAYPDATIDDMIYADGTFEFPITATNYLLGAQTPDADSKMCANSGKGQHIHLIVDNAPYAAKYENKFAHEVTDGEHHILAFLSRSYHESIKTDAAHTAQKVTVAGGSFTATEDIKDPMLFYSRPKGTYVGKKNTEKVMLDFYVVNLNLGEDYQVKVEINGEFEQMIDVWQPYYLEGLPMGDNKVKLTLIDGAGNTVDTPLNPVERVFTLKEDPAESSMGMQ
ncbi:MAG: phosphopeptide-binding protein [Bacteroidota bacterium]